MLPLILISFLFGGVQPQSAVIATYRDGAVSAEELDEWRRYLELAGRSTGVEQAVEDLVVVRVLASAVPEGLGASAEQERLEELRLQAAWLERRIVAETTPTEEEIRAAYQARKSDHDKPKRWRLSNVFLRVDADADSNARQAARGRLESLRERIVSGESFEEVARRHSDSQTRFRGGDMGFVSLDRLRGEVESVVARLVEGDLSPVLETPDGFLLLQCTAVLEARAQSLDDARPGLTKKLRARRADEARERLDDALQQEMSPALSDEVRWAEPDSVVATFRMRGSTRRLTVADLEVFGRPAELAELSSVDRRSLTMERWMLEARAEEARRRGCEEDRDLRIQIEMGKLERRAQIGANQLAANLVHEPSAERVEAWIEARQGRLVRAESRRLRALRVPRDPSFGREFFERLRAVGARFARDGGDLEQAARKLGPKAEVVDMGWLGDDQMWRLGRNVYEVVGELGEGEFSELVQEGPKFYVFEVAELRPERELTKDESRDAARSALLAASRKRAGQELRMKIFSEQKIEMRNDP